MNEAENQFIVINIRKTLSHMKINLTFSEIDFVKHQRVLVSMYTSCPRFVLILQFDCEYILLSVSIFSFMLGIDVFLNFVSGSSLSAATRLSSFSLSLRCIFM